MAKKVEKEEEVVSGSKSQLGSLLKQNKGDHYNYGEKVAWKISTGSLKLDFATGGIKPSLLRLCGKMNEGKTPQALEIIRQLFLTVPNSKAIWVVAEGRGLTEENTERCGLKFVYTEDEWEHNTVFVLESNVFELFINTVKTLVKDNPEKNVYAFVVDSVDGLILRADAEKEISENNKVAGVPSLSKKMLQSLALGMFKYGHLMILISQVTAGINLDTYAKPTDRGGSYSGGNSLNHAADFILEFQSTFNGDFILDKSDGKMNDNKSKVLGKFAKVLIIKSAVEASKKIIVPYPIKNGRKPSGIWLEYEIAELLIRWGMISKKGAWLSMEPEFHAELEKQFGEVKSQIQGLNNLKEWLEDNPNITQYLFDKFRSLI